MIEIMAGGCLASAFVWLQHHGAVRALAASVNSAFAAEWLAPVAALLPAALDARGQGLRST